MADSSGFALHRPEFLDALVRGEQKIAALMKGSAFSLPAGATLVDANTEHQYVYRLIKGWMGRSRLLEDGRNQFILIFMSGDLFAIKSMFITQHPDAIISLSNSVVERVNHRRLYESYSQDKDVALRTAWQLVEEERRLHNWVVGLGQGSAAERLALLLVEFLSRSASTSAAAGGGVQFEMPLTQLQLADHMGVTAVHINRVLRMFRENGFATVRDGRVVITNLDAVKRLATQLTDLRHRTMQAQRPKPSPDYQQTQR